MPAPPSDPTAASASPGASFSEQDAPPSSQQLVVEAKDSAPPPSGVTHNRMREVVRQFLASREKKKGGDFVRSVIIRRLGKDIEPELMGELVQTAFTECLEAKQPPLFAWGVPSWVGRVTRRAVAHYFQARKDDEEYLDHEAVAADQFDRHAPQTDWGARAHLINKWLERRIGDDPRKVETFRLMTEHAVVGRSVRELALENKTTEAALSNRFHKLRQELVPKIAIMDRENPRRAILLFLFLLALGVVVALVYGLLPHASPPPAVPATPELRPAPTVTAPPAPPPSFNQALPPDLRVPQPPDPPQPKP